MNIIRFVGVGIPWWSSGGFPCRGYGSAPSIRRGHEHDDRVGFRAGHRVRLTPLYWPRSLAAPVLALVLLMPEPASRTAGAPAWASPTGHPQGVQAVAFAPDGRRLATGGDDGATVLLEVGRGTEKELLGDPSHAVRCLAFSPDGASLAAGDDGCTVTLWDVATGRKRATLRGHSGPVKCLAFSPDGMTLATGSTDQSIRLWDLRAGELRATLLGHRRPVCAVCFAPDGRALASGCAEGLVKLWDVSDGRGRERPGSPGPPLAGPVPGLLARRGDAGLGKPGRRHQALGSRDRSGTRNVPLG